MKSLRALALACTILSCTNNSNSKTSQIELVDNEELKTLYNEDQSERLAGDIDWKVLNKRDSSREARVYELLNSGKVNTSEDYANAAMIFQHGLDTIASGMAVKMMRKAIELDSTRNKWLLAAAIDRDLMRRNKSQIFGTQYRRVGNEPWVLYDLDSTQITDEERIEYGVETLAEQQQKLLTMNKKELNELLDGDKNIDEIIVMISYSNLEDSEYDISEMGLNMFGYELKALERIHDALKIFELNTQHYPDGYNTFDSYGEILLDLGRKEEAIAAYEKSLALNPGNDNAKKVLADLRKE